MRNGPRSQTCTQLSLADTRQVQLTAQAEFHPKKQKRKNDGRCQGEDVDHAIVILQALLGGAEAMDVRVARQVRHEAGAVPDGRLILIAAERVRDAVRGAIDPESELVRLGAGPAPGPSTSTPDINFARVGGGALPPGG